jgi:hypothetical protein
MTFCLHTTHFRIEPNAWTIRNDDDSSMQRFLEADDRLR